MMHCSFNTGVAVLEQNRVTATTFVAVEKIFAAPSSAYSTSTAVVLLFGCIIVKQLARRTEVFPHAHTTIYTELLDLLFSATKGTYHLTDFMAWHVMSIFLIHIDTIFCLVMTMTAIIDFITARSSDAAPSPIM